MGGHPNRKEGGKEWGGCRFLPRLLVCPLAESFRGKEVTELGRKSVPETKKKYHVSGPAAPSYHAGGSSTIHEQGLA